MVISAAMTLPLMAALAGAQPERHLCRGWIPTEAAPERAGTVYAVTSVDPDGPGAGTPLLLFGSRGWDGRRYQPFPTGHVDEIRAMLWADLDGAGPGAPVLFGASTPVASYERGYVYTFGEAGWQSISPISGTWPAGTTLSALAAFDPDGPAGPLGVQVYAGGSFETPGRGLMAWDGSDWLAVPASPITAAVRTLAVFDPDGAGPAGARLIVAGEFQDAGSAGADFVVQWTGSAWQAMGTGLNGACTSSAFLDPDGIGPLAPRLYVGGSFTMAGGQPAGFIAQWDGAGWSPVGGGLDGPVESILAVDPDGNGPLPERLLVSGPFTTAGGVPAPWAAQWNGTAWSALTPTLDGLVYGGALHDADQDGPAAPALALCGTFERVGGVAFGDPAMWNGDRWYGITDCLADTARAVVLFDPDGAGEEPPRPIAGGDFGRAGYLPCGYIAERIGLHWRELGGGTDGPVSALALYQGAVIAGGSFSSAGGGLAPGIARWDGASWFALGDGLDGPVTALCPFDPDGPGPIGQRLAVGGIFTSAGSMPGAYIAVWDGSSWSALGSGLDGPVTAIAAFDPDGDGPLGDVLAVAGEFSMAGGTPASQLARWDGTSWSSLGQPPGTAVYALTSFDFDGIGPGGATVFAGGLFPSGNGFVAELSGNQWYQVGYDFNGPVRALICMDPDDGEYLPPVLVAGGDFTANSIDFTRGVAYWDGEYWTNMAGGVEGAALAFGVGFDHDGPTGLATHPILTVGTFTSAGQKPGCHFALYSFGGEPSVPLPPRDTVGHYGGTVSFPIEAEGLLPIQYHWIKGEEFLNDGPTPGGGVISGSSTRILTITGLSASDAGSYDCWVTSACGNSYSTPAALIVSCAADFNSDGFVDGIDYDQFNNAFEVGDTSADFNGDGFVDGIDYDEFNNAFEAGC